MGKRAQPDPPKPNIAPLLNASKYFLYHRNWENCRKYALKAQESDPSHPAPAQLLALASVLSACPSGEQPEPPDWYSVLGVPRFTTDQRVIGVRFIYLVDRLNPEKNRYPIASEALEWVFKAESVLSDRELKSQYDKELRRKEKEAQGDGGTFWTVCPYCYFMYEYEKVFLDCVLRCQNEKCKKGFTGLAVAASAVPPPEVLERGQYVCPGFFPLDHSNENKGSDGGWKWWEPFVSMGSSSAPGCVNNDEEKARTNEGSKTKTKNCNNIIALTVATDDEMAGEEEIKKRDDVAGQNGGKVVMKRRKMAALAKNKVTGKGIPVDWNLLRQGGERKNLRVEENKEGATTSGESEGSGGVAWKFSAEDDDGLLASLNSFTDMGCGGYGAY